MTKKEIKGAIRNLKNKKIDTIAFDMDDTLFQTSKHIISHVDDWITNISAVTGIDAAQLQSSFHILNGIAFEDPEIQVRHMRWQWICDQMNQQFPGFATTFIASGLTAYYESSPELFPKVKETLDALKSNNIKTLAITHSMPYWHQIKMRAHDLSHKFDYHHIVDPEHFPTKTANSWKDGISGLGSKPENTLSVGDGIKQDILASLAAGVHYAVHIKPSWEKFASGDLPQNVPQIDSIAGLIPLLASL